jgi:hypothetical protein
MEFRYFLETQTTFSWLNLQVHIEEVLAEHNLLGNDGSKVNKKFRVVFRYPRTATKAKIGHYEEDTVYVMAPTLQQAKQKVLLWLRTKLEPQVNSLKNRNNYLKDIDSKHLNVKGKAVKDWNDLLDLIHYLANTRMNDKTRATHFGENEARIFLDKARTSHRTGAILRTLPPREQRVFKLFYKQIQGYIPKDLDFYLRQMFKSVVPQPQQQSFLPQEPIQEPEQPQWKPLFAPKTNEDKERTYYELKNAASIRDVTRIANRYGLTYGELKQIHDDYGYQEYENEEDRLLGLRKELLRWMSPIRPGQKAVQEGDHARFASKWSTVMRYVRNNPDWTSFGTTEEELERNVWDFFVHGLPWLRPRYEYWKEALQRWIKEYEQNQEDDIPF